MYPATRLKRHCAIVILCTTVGLGTATAIAQEPPSAGPPSAPAAGETTSAIETAPIVIDGTTLFMKRGVSGRPAEKRLQAFGDRVQAPAANHGYSPHWLRFGDPQTVKRMLADKQLIMTVLASDARMEGVHRRVLVRAHWSRLGQAIGESRGDRPPKLLVRIVSAILAVLALVLFLWGVHRVVRKTRSALERRYREKIQGLQTQSFHAARAKHRWRLLTVALSSAWAVVVVMAVTICLHYLLWLFSWKLVTPLTTTGTSLPSAIPEVALAAILIVVTWYALRVLHRFYSGN